MRRLPIVIAMLVLLAVASVGIAWLSGYLPEFTIFGLIPVIIASYYLGFRYGVFIAVVASASELVSHIMLETGVSNREVIADAIFHSLVYFLTAGLITRLLGQLGTITGLERQRSFELDIAKKVHTSVFVPVPAQQGNLSIGSRLAFARELGGDYYFMTCLKDRLFFCIADISGKSIAAALFSALLNQSVTESMEHSIDLGAIIERINAHISPNLPEDMFITVFCALFYSGTLEYVNAGHPPPLHYSAQDGKSELLLSEHTLPMGVIADLDIEPSRRPFRQGDIFLATTDGITESATFRSQPLDKLAELLSRNAKVEAQAIADAVFTMALPGPDASPTDDSVVICIKKEEGQARPAGE